MGKNESSPGPWAACWRSEVKDHLWWSVGAAILSQGIGFLLYAVMRGAEAVKDQWLALIAFGGVGTLLPLGATLLRAYVKEARKQRDDAIDALFNERARQAHYIKLKLQSAIFDAREAPGGGGGFTTAYDCFKQLGEDLVAGVLRDRLARVVCDNLHLLYSQTPPGAGATADQYLVAKLASQGAETIARGMIDAGAVEYASFGAGDSGYKASVIGAWMLMNPTATPHS